MNTKLTLTIDRRVIKKAKMFAKDKERSLSDLVENYLKALTADVSEARIELTPIVKSLKGSFKAPHNLDYKKELSENLAEKYL